MTKYLFCVCTLAAGLLFAQEKTDQPRYQLLYQEAQTAYQNKEYEKSAKLYLDAAALPEAAEWQGGILYNVGCDYALLGEAKKAFDYLRRAIDAGYTDHRWMKKDTDFDFLRRSDSIKFNEMIDLTRLAERNERLFKSPIAIIAYDNYDGPTEISKHVWDNYNDPMMDSLRRKYGLAKIVAPGKTEFEKLKLLLDWVSHRWEHSGDNECKEWNALAILSAAEKGERFRCVEYAVVLANCLDAIGIPARIVALARNGVAYGTGKGHVCAEAWSNQFQKWILLDGQNDAWWEAGSIPLNAHESRNLFVNARDEEMKFIGQRPEFDYGSIQSNWEVYFHHVSAGYHHAFFIPATQEQTYNVEFLSDSVMPELFFQKFPQQTILTSSIEQFYPRLNQTSIRFLHTNLRSPSDTLDIMLSHTMPFFEKFKVRLNEGEWDDSPGSFRWVMRKGNNTIEAKAINLAGIEGRPSRIVLKNNIGVADKR